MAFQFRRGTDIERQSITPKAGEPLFVTDTGKVYVGNGTTQGGLLVSAAVSDDDSPSLGGNLDLNNNNIIGTGNINIDGSITATGSINLGDGVEDNIIVGGVIGSNLIPDTDGLYDLGTGNFYWRKGYFEDVVVDGELSANSLQVKSIELDDSTTVFDSETNSLFVGSIVANNIEGNFVGSMFGDDSTLLVDAISNSFNTISLTLEEDSITVKGQDPLRVFSNLGARFNNENIDGSIEGNLLVQNASRTQSNAISPVLDNDYISGYASAAYNGIEFAAKSLIATKVLPGGGSNQPSTLEFYIEDNDENFINAFSINSNKSVSADIFQTGSYSDEDARDAAIPNPAAGMIILLTGHNDSTGTPKFQGYDGTNWIDFN